MIAADCRLQESKDVAELIVEARVGTLGSDSNEVIYGIPASNALSSAASLVPNGPMLPQIPEISLASPWNVILRMSGLPGALTWAHSRWIPE